MEKFVPRVISAESAALGFNNAGRGQSVGWISDVTRHEKSCPYRKDQLQNCACRVGLWQEKVKPKKAAPKRKPHKRKR